MARISLHTGAMAVFKRIAPVLLIVALLGVFYAAGLQHLATFQALGRQQASLRAFAAAQPVLAPLAYIVVYAIVVALSVPAGSLLSVCGGMLFGWLAGSCYAVLAATAGAVLVFLAARSALADIVTRRAGGAIERLRPRLQRDGFNYLLVLRLLPVVPFWLVNLAAPIAGMRLVTFAAGTLIGIIPATSVYVWLGTGFGEALAAGQRLDLSVIFSASVLLPLLALAGLALLPVGWRAWRTRHA